MSSPSRAIYLPIRPNRLDMSSTAPSGWGVGRSPKTLGHIKENTRTGNERMSGPFSEHQTAGTVIEHVCIVTSMVVRKWEVNVGVPFSCSHERSRRLVGAQDPRVCRLLTDCGRADTLHRGVFADSVAKAERGNATDIRSNSCVFPVRHEQV